MTRATRLNRVRVRYSLYLTLLNYMCVHTESRVTEYKGVVT